MVYIIETNTVVQRQAAAKTPVQVPSPRAARVMPKKYISIAKYRTDIVAWNRICVFFGLLYKDSGSFANLCELKKKSIFAKISLISLVT
jgi:hypothetical protein